MCFVKTQIFLLLTQNIELLFTILGTCGKQSSKMISFNCPRGGKRTFTGLESQICSVKNVLILPQNQKVCTTMERLQDRPTECQRLPSPSSAKCHPGNTYAPTQNLNIKQLVVTELQDSCNMSDDDDENKGMQTDYKKGQNNYKETQNYYKEMHIKKETRLKSFCVLPL